MPLRQPVEKHHFENDMMQRLAVVLFRPRISENIGSVARACANMGCSRLILVDPREWDRERAGRLATSQGREILDTIECHSTLKEALSQFSVVYGTTARTGGWRKGLLTPEEAAARIAADTARERDVAIVFGPEDRGLTNTEIDTCGQLLVIPTAGDSSSLNLAHAVLIILYECFKRAGGEGDLQPAGPELSRPVTHQEQEVLFSHLEQALTAIDYVKQDNLRYWMLPLRRFMQRLRLRHNEYNLLMGICRQVMWKAGLAERRKDEGERMK